MEVELEREATTTMQEGSSSSLGWPFGLPTCIAIHTPSPTPALAFHQQFMNLQTTFLLPFFSDVGESSSSDSDARSEAASSFFKDSRRITLGSLIGLPMDHSFHHPDQNFHAVFAAPSSSSRPSQAFCVPVLELLRCVRNSESSDDLGFSDDPQEPPASTSTAYLHVDTGAMSIILPALEDAASNGSHSPDWNQQFVSCHSVLSDDSSLQNVIPSPRKQKRMQRSVSMKSFFSSICCRIDAVQSRPQEHLHRHSG